MQPTHVAAKPLRGPVARKKRSPRRACRGGVLAGLGPWPDLGMHPTAAKGAAVQPPLNSSIK